MELSQFQFTLLSPQFGKHLLIINNKFKIKFNESPRVVRVLLNKQFKRALLELTFTRFCLNRTLSSGRLTAQVLTTYLYRGGIYMYVYTKYSYLRASEHCSAG